MRQPVIIRTPRPTLEEVALTLGIPNSRVKFLRALADRLTKEEMDQDGNATHKKAKSQRKRKTPAKPSLASPPRA